VEIAPDTPRFMADVEQVERALINLVENAIKFSVGGGQVTIRVYGENRNILFEIRDYGIGIPEKLQSQLFNRFVRGAKLGQKGAEHISGSGLGLSLVKAIVDNHHGQVWLRSHEGQGSRFYISLPALIPETA
jgi:signal transduction histidine kinase